LEDIPNKADRHGSGLREEPATLSILQRLHQVLSETNHIQKRSFELAFTNLSKT
jgi:hypothetical protein